MLQLGCAVPVAGVVVEGRARNMDVATLMCCTRTCGRGGCGVAGWKYGCCNSDVLYLRQGWLWRGGLEIWMLQL
jgi:hypothetical protein